MLLFIDMLPYTLLIAAIVSLGFMRALAVLIPDPKLQLTTQLVTYPMLLTCVFFLGAVYVNENIKQKILEQASKVAIAEQEAQRVNKDLNAKSQATVKTIRLKGERVIEYVDREVRVYDNTCIIPETFIQAHNMAAEK